jgi:hypothetical protein
MTASRIEYQIIDSHTGAVVGKCSTRSGANRSVDRLDYEYGGYRFMVRPVWKDVPCSPT